MTFSSSTTRMRGTSGWSTYSTGSEPEGSTATASRTASRLLGALNLLILKSV